jgi:hypothetical protein
MKPAFPAPGDHGRASFESAAPVRVSLAEDDPRIAVWQALSNLYLDNDVSLEYPHIAQTLADSPYTLEALHEMLMYDVHPALHANLMIVAGEWAGFDREWLLERIAQTRAQPRWRRRLTHLFVRWIRDDWRIVAAIIAQLRAEPPAELHVGSTTSQAPQA